MNKTITIAVIALVAVVMGMSVITPVMAHDVTERQGQAGNGTCPDDFTLNFLAVEDVGKHPDHNKNRAVCTNGHVIVDDLPCKAFRGQCPPGGGV